MWTTIYDKLNIKNLNPYPIGTHTGICEIPYCVIKEGMQIPSINTNRLGQKVIDIIVFVPVSDYSAVETYIKQVRSALSELPFLRKSGSETPIIPDDDKKAFTMSIEYTIMKKLEG